MENTELMKAVYRATFDPSVADTILATASYYDQRSSTKYMCDACLSTWQPGAILHRGECFARKGNGKFCEKHKGMSALQKKDCKLKAARILKDLFPPIPRQSQ
jgi:hypothetical protein